MKKVLVIGSAVCDVTIRLEHLPAKCEDVHVLSQKMSPGGCAFNVFDMIRHFPVPAIPFLPTGTGAYGDFVRGEFAKRGIKSVLPQPDEDNGCCYCFVEADGERTFICYHGAEYKFYPEWFETLDTSGIDSAYICGLEIEEETGPVIIDFLERNPHIQIYFGPGPRITKIDQTLMNRIFALHPILHLNETEVMEATGCKAPQEGAKVLSGKTKAPVIVTLGKDGCYLYDGENEHYAPGIPATQIDTNGAGDGHMGAMIACLKLGMNYEDAMATANRIAAKIIENPGTMLSDEQFKLLQITGCIHGI